MTDLLDDILPAEPNPAWAPYPPHVIIVTLDEDEFVAVEQLAVLRKTDPVHLMHDLLRQAMPSNGHAGYEVTCFGCGAKFTVTRRPVPGRHQWCDTCRASGEPAAQRARDYRARKSG